MGIPNQISLSDDVRLPNKLVGHDEGQAFCPTPWTVSMLWSREQLFR
jgi:hypothetical protein